MATTLVLDEKEKTLLAEARGLANAIHVMTSDPELLEITHEVRMAVARLENFATKS